MPATTSQESSPLHLSTLTPALNRHERAPIQTFFRRCPCASCSDSGIKGVPAKYSDSDPTEPELVAKRI
jgi:hypothetical protein